MRRAAAARLRALAVAAAAAGAVQQRPCALALALRRGMAAHGGGGAAAAAAAADATGPRVAATIVARWDETPTVAGLRLAVASGAAAQGFSFRAGQWVDLWAPGLKPAGGFSIVSTPAELEAGGTFDLGIKAAGHPVTQWLHSERAVPGAKVRGARVRARARAGRRRWRRRRGWQAPRPPRRRGA